MNTQSLGMHLERVCRSAGLYRRLLLSAVLASECLAGICQAGGTVSGWGDDTLLQSDAPAGLAGVIAVAAGPSHSVALRSDGTVITWGGSQIPVPMGLTNVIAIAAGSNYTVALQSDGTVQTWGTGISGPPSLGSVVAIAAGVSHALALQKDGTLVSWGGQSSTPATATNVTAIAAGNGQSLALRSDGTVVAWGDNSFGKAEVPAGLTNVVSVAAGADHCLALRRDGTVVCWGRNDSGQSTAPSSVTNVVAIAAGGQHSLALKADGTLVAWGGDAAGQVSSTPSGSGYVGIAAGGDHNLAIIGDGSPVIVRQPASQTVDHLLTATLSVTALGTAPLSYQWQHAGTPVVGATNSVLVVPSVQPYNGGIYTVLVSNVAGAVTSDPAILTIGGLGPQIVSSPQEASAHCGDSVSFQALAKGPSSSLRLYYRWLFNGVPIDGATTNSLNLTNATTANAGQYTIVVTNIFGSASATATLTVVVDPPQVTSPLQVSATEGLPFQYRIVATHTPQSFAAVNLPLGLSLDPASGVISGIPQESGNFGPVLSAVNSCTTGTATLMLNINSAAPSLRAAPGTNGTETVPLQYQIVATGANLSYAALNLPPGLSVNPGTGLIQGTPVLAGDYVSTVSASNAWGTARTTVHFTIVNAPVAGLSLGNVNYSYSSPYLLDFSFSLLNDNDPSIGNGIVADPSELKLDCFEDGLAISASETGAFAAQVATKVVKAYLVLDFTESIATLANGDTNGDGISDAVDSMVNGSIAFVNQQSSDTRIGVYEFHREDMSPSNVVSLTTDKTLVTDSIAGIWTNNVQGFPSGSRCWDAAMAAVLGLGTSNRDEMHFVILVSDGRDESSTNTAAGVIAAASAANVQLFLVGFGAELDAATLQNMAAQTQGRYYEARSPADIARQLAQISKMARGQYILRWATLKRSSRPFTPSFQITYQGLTALSPTNTLIPATTNIDVTVDPPVTNIIPGLTNIVIADFTPTNYAGSVLIGSLRLAPNAEIHPTGIDLRATYVPRYIRQLRLHYRANWPCNAVLQSAGPGELLSGWSLNQTNDGAGGTWLLLSSPYPDEATNSLPFASFGKLLTFVFQDPINVSNAFSVLEVDNSIYGNTGGQSFAFENSDSVLKFYPALPQGTPVLWLQSFGYSGDYTNAENLDPDGDGVPNWQEFRANTNPTNAASVFGLRSVVQRADGRYVVTFSTATNRIYRVDASSNLVNWRTVLDQIAGTDGDTSVVDAAYVPYGSPIFYRAVVY
jgi:hypothetical protein